MLFRYAHSKKENGSKALGSSKLSKYFAGVISKDDDVEIKAKLAFVAGKGIQKSY